MNTVVRLYIFGSISHSCIDFLSFYCDNKICLKLKEFIFVDHGKVKRDVSYLRKMNQYCYNILILLFGDNKLNLRESSGDKNVLFMAVRLNTSERIYGHQIMCVIYVILESWILWNRYYLSFCLLFKTRSFIVKIFLQKTMDYKRKIPNYQKVFSKKNFLGVQ